MIVDFNQLGQSNPLWFSYFLYKFFLNDKVILLSEFTLSVSFLEHLSYFCLMSSQLVNILKS